MDKNRGKIRQSKPRKFLWALRKAGVPGSNPGGLIINYQKGGKMAKTGKVENEKICAALSYILIGIIWYFADEKMKKSELARYHAKQGLVLLIAAICYSIVLSILFSILIFPMIITGAGLGAMGLIGILNLLNLVPLIFVIIGIINAVNEKEKPLPIIGKLGDKFSF